jgi:hypothetical protein
MQLEAESMNNDGCCWRQQQSLGAAAAAGAMGHALDGEHVNRDAGYAPVVILGV